MSVDGAMALSLLSTTRVCLCVRVSEWMSAIAHFSRHTNEFLYGTCNNNRQTFNKCHLIFISQPKRMEKKHTHTHSLACCIGSVREKESTALFVLCTIDLITSNCVRVYLRTFFIHSCLFSICACKCASLIIVIIRQTLILYNTNCLHFVS